MNRRNFAAHVPAALAGAALAACGGGNAADERKPTFVFVHGAWHGGWCWSEVARLLAAKGYASVPLDHPGHGITARLPAAYTAKPQDLTALATEVSPLAALTLDDYRDSVLGIIRGLVAAGSGPVILVGHSSGGATLSAVAEAEPTLIRRLVYLTAFVPVRFPTVLQYLQQPAFAASEVPPLFVADPAVVGAARINHDSADAAYVARVRSAFYHDVSDAQFAAVANLLTPGHTEPWEEVRDTLNRSLRGWSNYFAYGTCRPAFRGMDQYVTERVRAFLARRHKVQGRGNRRFTYDVIHGERGVLALERLPRPASPWAWQ